MDADEVAVFLGVDRKTVYDYAGRGEIPHRRLGKRLLFSRSAIVEWLGARDSVNACKVAQGRKG
jgi:excisionase family DNA binding protein